MSANFFYEKLGYEQLTKCSNIPVSNPEYQELGKIGADKVYFSGDFPAILFKEVSAFNADALQQISEIQHKAWNYRKVMFLFVVSDTEIRIYNCHEKPQYIKPESNYKKELKLLEVFSSTKDDETNLKILVELFSQIGVDSGLLWTSDYTIREKVDIQNRIDRFLVKSLVDTAELLNKDIKNKEIIHGLLMRSLFILYLEDKSAAEEAGLYAKIKKGAKSYFDILDDVDATYRLFDELHKHFNGNVFPVLKDEHLKIKKEHLIKIKNCFTDGNITSSTLLPDWRIFKFDFIQIELLSEVYENFLGELEEKREKGQFYTPYTLVELILNDKLPIKKETEYNVKVLDPACGSGIFLVESYKRLIRRWQNANPTKKISFQELHDILVNNIFGIEIHPLAIRVTAFSLYLALVEHLDPKRLWLDKSNQFPYLINDPEDDSLFGKQGKNLWRGDTIEIDANKFIKADLLIGNPPFGARKLPESIKKYCAKYDFGKEMVLPFMHKAVEFCPNGNIALIFGTKVLTNTEKPFQNFRNWLLNKNYVEKIYNLSIFRMTPKNFGGQLFSSAIVPISIVYFQKETPTNPSKTIEYWVPKTYIKSNLIEGVVIDDTDIKYLPRVECQMAETNIWKISMWGGVNDFNLINQLKDKFQTLDDYLKKDAAKKNPTWKYGRGVHPEYKKEFICPDKILPIDNIGRYYIDSSQITSNTTKYRPIKEGLFDKKFVVVKETLLDNRLCASYVEHKCCTPYSTYVFGSNDIKKIKMLTAFINSIFAHYFLFLTASEWGVKTPRILQNELLGLPSLMEFDNFPQDFVNSVNELVSKPSTFLGLDAEINRNEKIVNDAILNLFDLSEKEKILIDDLVKIQYDLYIRGQHSIALRRILSKENESYIKILSAELNAFYKDAGYNIGITSYDVQYSDPLNLVVVHFNDTEKNIKIQNANALAPLLRELNKYSIQEKGKNIYVQKQFRYYDNDKIYLIKPNQKRFWTRSQAMDDAISLIVEIANMGGER